MQGSSPSPCPPGLMVPAAPGTAARNAGAATDAPPVDPPGGAFGGRPRGWGGPDFSRGLRAYVASATGTWARPSVVTLGAVRRGRWVEQRHPHG